MLNYEASEKREGSVSVPNSLSIVIPVYRSAECLEPLLEAIHQVYPPHEEPEVILVNDCSPDESWQVIERLCATYPHVIGIDLHRNCGQDKAILEGLRHTRGAYIAIMDDDLQHHPHNLPRLFAPLQGGADVVYALFRVKRQKLWKNVGSWFNGKVGQWLTGKPPDLYLSAYKTMTREVAELVLSQQADDPYVDELIFQVTARVVQVPVDHYARLRGHSTYTFGECVKVCCRHAFSSLRPLRAVYVTGLAMVFCSIAVVVMGLLNAECRVPLLFSFQLFLAGLQLACLGLVGEYVGRARRTVNRMSQSAVHTRLGGRSSAHSPTLAEATPQEDEV